VCSSPFFSWINNLSRESHSQYNARPAVTFLAVRHLCPFVSSNLYCLETDGHCVWTTCVILLAESGTAGSQTGDLWVVVRSSNHYTTSTRPHISRQIQFTTHRSDIASEMRGARVTMTSAERRPTAASPWQPGKQSGGRVRPGHLQTTSSWPAACWLAPTKPASGTWPFGDCCVVQHLYGSCSCCFRWRRRRLLFVRRDVALHRASSDHDTIKSVIALLSPAASRRLLYRRIGCCCCCCCYARCEEMLRRDFAAHPATQCVRDSFRKSLPTLRIIIKITRTNKQKKRWWTL